MTATISTSPQYPLVTKIAIAVASTESEAAFVSVRPSAAPPDSEIGRELKKKAGARWELVRLGVVGGIVSPWQFLPDRPGVYTFQLDELREISSANRFEDDSIAQSGTEVLATSTVRVFVGERVNIPIGSGNNSATLIVHVWDGTIRQTTFAQHGIDSPALDGPRSKLAAMAVLDPAVISAVSSIADSAAADLVDDNAGLFDLIRSRYSTHVSNETQHTNEDTDNAVPASWAAGDSRAAELAITKLYQSLDRHTKTLRLTEPVVTPGDPPTVSWNDVHGAEDGTTSFLTTGPGGSTIGQLMCLMDVWDRMRTHAAMAGPVHAASATPAALPSLGPLAQLFLSWFAAIRTGAAGVTPDYRNSGAALLEASL